MSPELPFMFAAGMGAAGALVEHYGRDLLPAFGGPHPCDRCGVALDGPGVCLGCAADEQGIRDAATAAAPGGWDWIGQHPSGACYQPADPNCRGECGG